MLSISAILLLLNSAQASLKTIPLSTKIGVPKTRWVYEGAPTQLKGVSLTLAKMKYSSIQSNSKECLTLAQKAWSDAVSIRPWILLNEARCALSLPDKERAKSLKSLIARVEGFPKWMLAGPSAIPLRKIFIQAQMSVIELEFAKKNQDASVLAQKVFEYKEWLSTEEKGRLYRILGELAYLKQDLKTAKDYFNRSVNEFEDSEVRSRIAAVDGLLKLAPPKPQEAVDVAVLTEEISGKVIERMTTALKAGELISAVQDGIEIIKNYPGSIHAEWAFGRITEVYANLSSRQPDGYAAMREKLVSLMGEADGKRIEQWATKSFNMQLYSDCATLSEQGIEKSKGSGANTNLLLLAAKSYLYSRDFPKAHKYFKELIEKHGGTDSALQAMFYTGLMGILDKEYVKAISAFDKLLAQPESTDYELMARYWLWRALENTDQERAKKEADIIATQFPFSYYGLLAKAETNGNVIEFPNFKKPIILNAKISLTQTEYDAWERAKILIAAGWYEEAQSELLSISLPTDLESQALLARYLAASFAYPKAIELVNKVWDENETYRSFPFVEVSFPREFSKVIKEHAGKNNLAYPLVWGVIKQESAFAIQAVSKSGALGLMQLIPPTAKEVSGLLRYKGLKLPDTMFDPTVNVKFGTYYLARVIKQMEGNVPLALAGYNAGPTKVKQWMSSFKMAPQASSKYEYDVWIDLLPWSETRFYVKAILRNWIIYKILEEGKYVVSEPVWSGAVVTPAVAENKKNSPEQ